MNQGPKINTGTLTQDTLSGALSPKSITIPEGLTWHAVSDEEIETLSRINAPIQTQIAIFSLGLFIPSAIRAMPAIKSIVDEKPIVEGGAWLIVATGALVALCICGVNAVRGKGQRVRLLENIRRRKRMPLQHEQ